MERHVTGRALLFTFVGLLVLTALSWVASELPLGDAEFPVAMVIASVKATLVLLFFMHAIEETSSTIFALLSGIFFVLLLATSVAVEVATRAPTSFIPSQ